MPNKCNRLLQLQNQIIHCTRCPRLVAWRQKVADEKVRRYLHELYWGKPVPGFGSPDAKLLLVGLAPAAHGGNRTGRMFTGDRSGDLLYATLYKFGFANQPHSTNSNDGLSLENCYVTAALRCAPPQNRPTSEEKNNCFPYLVHEIRILKNVQIIIALGKIAFDTLFNAYKEIGQLDHSKRPKFGHGVKIKLNSRITLMTSYHPSQQNTSTGKLTQPMFDDLFKQAKDLIEGKAN
ncbi:MAG: uracil-DNA glycosylase [bacterium]